MAKRQKNGVKANPAETRWTPTMNLMTARLQTKTAQANMERWGRQLIALQELHERELSEKVSKELGW